MANTDEETEVEKDGGASEGVGPWAARAVSVLLLTTSFAVASVLFAMFWLARPVNLAPRTDELVALLEEALREHYIPEGGLERTGPDPQELAQGNTVTRWHAYTYEVTVPDRINTEGLKAFLRNKMSSYDVRVTDKERSPDSPVTERLAFYLQEFEFADMALLPGGDDPNTTHRSDLRSQSLQLADLVVDVLVGLPTATPPQREDAQAREDLNSLWNYTRIAAVLPPGMTLGALKARIEGQLNVLNARVETESDLIPDVNLVLTIDGRPCVGIACTVTSGQPMERPTPVDLDSVLVEGVVESVPEEAMPERPEPEGAAMPEGVAEEGAPMEVTPPEAPAEVMEGPVEEALAPPGPRGTAPKPNVRMAIIIDDGGYVRADSERVLALDTRLTLAILPNTPHGAMTAREGAEKGFEIMLHMPMETDSGSEEAVEGTLFTAMGKNEIQKLTRNALDQYPEVVGVNNHTGSKFTSNGKKMDLVFEVLKERDLFFIDSYTKSSSVAYEGAQKAGLRTARRDVFLDNLADKASIKKQFDELVERALSDGSAIGIGHFQKPNTAIVLAEEIPKLAEAGITLVHASELVQ